jgi:hypothetical protein
LASGECLDEAGSISAPATRISLEGECPDIDIGQSRTFYLHSPSQKLCLGHDRQLAGADDGVGVFGAGWTDGPSLFGASGFFKSRRTLSGSVEVSRMPPAAVAALPPSPLPPKEAAAAAAAAAAGPGTEVKGVAEPAKVDLAASKRKPFRSGAEDRQR